MHISYDDGLGGTTGRWLTVSFGGAWRVGLRSLRTWRKVHPYGSTYSPVSFR